jgi:hypothetical protein
MTGDAGAGMGVINVVLCGPVYVAAGLMRHYVSRLALPVPGRLADHSDWLATAKVRVLLNRV